MPARKVVVSLHQSETLAINIHKFFGSHVVVSAHMMLIHMILKVRIIVIQYLVIEG